MRYRMFLLVAFAIVLAWSVWQPHDLFTWFLETFPAFIGLALILAFRQRFPLTPLLLTLLLIHAVILMVGGHYTYAMVPLGFRMQEWFGLPRNDYDRIGHFAQGFIPAIVAREILVRRRVVNGRGWLYALIVCICLAISAAYELLEFGVSVATGSKGDAFLGTQGDVWDTQKDMLTALVGAMIAPPLFGGWHDRQIQRLQQRSNRA